jgi:hypothetical protein
VNRLLATVLLVIASRTAAGCSYDLRLYNTVEKRFVASRIVALAEVVSSAREKFSYDMEYEGIREVVVFRVLEVWKGPIKAGMKLVTSSDIDGCGLNVRNSPPILESPDGPVDIGNVWLLYLRGDSPYELTQQLGSFPLIGAASELPEIYRLAEVYQTKGKANGAKPNKSLERTRER